YRDFIGEPDEILAEFGFGRAHHRVLHFVTRNPGLRVADLLDILKITKQSLGRVLKQLVDEGYIQQETGKTDRRERRLFATPLGRALTERLARPQAEKLARSLAAAGGDSALAVRRFLNEMIAEDARASVSGLNGRRERSQ
ncbi:MAG: MarR family winged helix-turn-helix transcriptional regulator, partial [Hyphomicrobiales bacterium]